MKVKVIFLPYIFQVLYVLCFTRPRYQVSVYRTTGPLVFTLNSNERHLMKGLCVRVCHQNMVENCSSKQWFWNKTFLKKSYYVDWTAFFVVNGALAVGKRVRDGLLTTPHAFVSHDCEAITLKGHLQRIFK